MVASLFEVRTRWQCSFTSQEMLLQPHLIANNGLFGINYGTYQSLTRFAILLGEPVVRYFPQRRTYGYIEYCWIAPVKNVVQPQRLQVICSGLDQELNRFRVARSYRALLDRINFIPSMIYSGFC